MESNKELSLEIKLRGWLILSMSQASFSMKESLPSRLERSSWVSHLLAAWLKRIKAFQVEVLVQAHPLLLLHLETIASMVDLEVKI